MFNVQDEPESPNEGACLRYESDSRNEGGLRVPRGANARSAISSHLSRQGNGPTGRSTTTQTYTCHFRDRSQSSEFSYMLLGGHG